METQATRLPIHNREAFPYCLAVPSMLGSTLITALMGTDDQAALNANGAYVVAEATVTDLLAQIAADGTLTIAAQPDFARNVVIAAHNDSGGPLLMYVGTFTVKVVGTFRGEVQTEDINITLVEAKKSIANTKYRAWAGVKPFDSVTSITFVTPSATYPAAGLKLAVGLGCKVGLPMKPFSNVASDVIHLIIDGTLTAIGSLYSTTNETLQLGTLADTKGFFLLYWTNLSSIRKRLLGV